MSLHFTSTGTPLSPPVHVAAPRSPLGHSSSLTSLHNNPNAEEERPHILANRPVSALLRQPLNLHTLSTMHRSNTEPEHHSSSFSFSPSSSSLPPSHALLSKHPSMPLSPPPVSTPAEALDQSISFLGLLVEQLNQPRDSINPQNLQREVNHIIHLLQHARSNQSSSVQDVQRTLLQDVKRMAKNSVQDDEVMDLISQYNAPSRSLEDRDDADLHASMKLRRAKSIRPPESEAAHNFRSTMLAIRWIKRVREATHRRALQKSPWDSILKLHISDPIQALLKGADEWDFDLFALEQLAGNRVLSVLAYHLFEHRLGFFKQFGIKPAFFANFIAAIEDGYNDVPYHSHIHAADVMQNTYYFLTRESQRSKITDLDLFAGCIAAAIHDFQHEGTNNLFAISTSSKYAMRYNDRSVLENMHASEGLLVSRRLHHDIFSGLKAAAKAEARSTIINMVLATDMSNHFKNLAELKAQLESHTSKNLAWSSSSAHDRMLVCENALHCADLGNPTKPLPIYLEWTDRVMQEFYNQGDKERELNLPISPMMDRNAPSVEKSQIGFISFIVAPLFETYQKLNPEIQHTCLVQVGKNKQHFADLVAKMAPPPPPQAAAAPSSSTASSSSAAAPKSAAASPATTPRKSAVKFADDEKKQ